MIYQFFALLLIISVVYAIAYRKGKVNKERNEEPTLAKKENQEYLKFKLFDQMMTDDDFFSDDIAESSNTDTNNEELK